MTKKMKERKRTTSKPQGTEHALLLVTWAPPASPRIISPAFLDASIATARTIFSVSWSAGVSSTWAGWLDILGTILLFAWGELLVGFTTNPLAKDRTSKTDTTEARLIMFVPVLVVMVYLNGSKLLFRNTKCFILGRG
jgi:hypothetical protein